MRYTVFAVLAAGIAGTVTAQVTNVSTEFTSDPKTEMMVRWRTGTANTASDVRHGLTAAYGSTTSGTDTLTSFGGLEHHVKLTGLTPGTVYHYQCGGGAEWSRDGTFRTAPAGNEDFMFVAPGDIQVNWCSNVARQEAVFWQARNVAFWIPLGDLVSIGADDQGDWNDFFCAMDTLTRHSVMMPLIGNHELRGVGMVDYLYPQVYLNQFALPSNGDSAYQGHHYSFEYGDALFIVLGWDNNTWWPDCHAVQRAWMDSLLSRTTKTWKFVFLHPPIYWSTVSQTERYPDWTDVWDQYKVNAVFSGDGHYLEICWPIYNNAVVASYAEGALYYQAPNLNGTNVVVGAWFTKTKASGDPTAFVAPAVEVFADSAVVTTWDWNNGVAYDRIVLPVRSGQTGRRAAGAGRTVRQGVTVRQVAGVPEVVVREEGRTEVVVVDGAGRLVWRLACDGPGTYTMPGRNRCGRVTSPLVAKVASAQGSATGVVAPFTR